MALLTCREMLGKDEKPTKCLDAFAASGYSYI